MKILKEGKIETRYVGQCELCGAVIECAKDELLYTDNNADVVDTTYYNLCAFCNDGNVVFHKVNTKDAKSILRKNYLKALYK